jgi:hypothetical protein
VCGVGGWEEGRGHTRCQVPLVRQRHHTLITTAADHLFQSSVEGGLVGGGEKPVLFWGQQRVARGVRYQWSVRATTHLSPLRLTTCVCVGGGGHVSTLEVRGDKGVTQGVEYHWPVGTTTRSPISRNCQPSLAQW